MSIGIVIPTYNEQESIAALLNAIRTDLPDALITVVDDSRNDLTAAAVRPFIGGGTHLLRRSAKGGRGSAVIEGMRYLLGHDISCVVEMDADLSHPVAQILPLANKLSSEGMDLVIASRYLPGSRIENWPLHRRLFSLASNRLARAVLGVPIHDYTNGFRCYSRRAANVVADSCGRLGAGFIVLSEIVVNLYYRGYRVAEAPTIFVNRVRGESSLGVGDITSALHGLLRIYRLKAELKRRAA